MDSTASNPEPAPVRGPEPHEGAGPPERKSLVFRVAEDLFACDIGLVREIVRFGRMSRIPGAPPFVRGLLNVRGEILAILDVGVRLEPDRVPMDGGSVIVVDVEGRQAGLVVAEVIGVHAIVPEEGSHDQPRRDADIVRHLGHLDGRIVLYLDVRAFVNQSLV